MATRPKHSKLDDALDEAQLARIEMLGRVEQALNSQYHLQRVTRDVWDDLVQLREDLAHRDEQGEGGKLFVSLCAARAARERRRSPQTPPPGAPAQVAA